MSYKIYTDKDEKFQCQVFLEGASLTKSIARLIVDFNGTKLMFEGTIDKDGKCEVPIKRLKNVLAEGDDGKMKLEVIADDTFFQPWQSEFLVETSKKMKIEIQEQKEPEKPKMKVVQVKNNSTSASTLADILIERDISITQIMDNKKKFIPIIKTYLNESNSKKNINKFLNELLVNLNKT